MRRLSSLRCLALLLFHVQFMQPSRRLSSVCHRCTSATLCDEFKLSLLLLETCCWPVGRRYTRPEKSESIPGKRSHKRVRATLRSERYPICIFQFYISPKWCCITICFSWSQHNSMRCNYVPGAKVRRQRMPSLRVDLEAKAVWNAAEASWQCLSKKFLR